MNEQTPPQKHTIPNDATEQSLAEPPREDNIRLSTTLFVYGTLRRGQANHDRFCRNAIDIQPATTWGRLYDLGAFPALEVPESAILAHGTADPLADAATQARLTANLPPHAVNHPPSGDWDLIQGELITFPDPARDLPPIDRLEGFRPLGKSYYQRVLVTARKRNAATCTAWTYLVTSTTDLPRRTGLWGTG